IVLINPLRALRLCGNSFHWCEEVSRKGAKLAKESADKNYFRVISLSSTTPIRELSVVIVLINPLLALRLCGNSFHWCEEVSANPQSSQRNREQKLFQGDQLIVHYSN